MLLIILANALFASTYTITKYLLAFMGPLYLLGFRMFLAGFLLMGYQYLKAPHALFITSRRIWWHIAQIAFFNTYLSYALEFWALKYMSSIKVTFIYNLAPLVTPLYSYLFFREKMTVKKWIGLTIGIVGITPALLFSHPQEELFAMVGGFISLPEIAVLGGLFAYCYGWIYMRKLIRDFNMSPVVVNAWIMIIGGILALINAALFESYQPITDTTSFIVMFAALVILGNLTSSVIYASLFRYYTVTFISFTTLSIPLFAGVYGYLFLNESMTMQFILSSVIVTIGLYIFYQEELRQGYILPRKKA